MFNVSLESKRKVFKVECVFETKIHKVGLIYDAVTYDIPDSYIYVEDEKNYSYIVYSDFFDLIEFFKIL